MIYSRDEVLRSPLRDWSDFSQDSPWIKTRFC